MAADRVFLDFDRDGYTGGLQVSIALEDERGAGHGHRLAGPKYLGGSTRLLRVPIDEDAAREIRWYLDRVHPVALPGGDDPEAVTGDG